MNPDEKHQPIAPVSDGWLDRAREQTPARILVGRAGSGYRTRTQLDLRADHAYAKDAVVASLDLARDLGLEFVDLWNLFEVGTRATTRQEFLLRPDLGRVLSDAAKTKVEQTCPPGADLQVVIGDGLSAAAVKAQIPALLPLLERETRERGWTWGRPFFVRHCRVGVMNDVGALLKPAVVVLLIGERPGLATAESLSAYMAFHPRRGDDDSRRNLISTIHPRGVPADQAASRILLLADQMRRTEASGVAIKEELPARQIGHTGSRS